MVEQDEGTMAQSEAIVAALTWMTLGDGNITIVGGREQHPNRHGFFQVMHTDRHEDYVRMKAALIRHVTDVNVNRRYHSRRQSYNWQLYSRCHPVFTQLHKRIYLGKRKVIDPHAVKLLTPLALAILYQDDGRYAPKKHELYIHKPLFSVPELELLAKGIVDKWGIIFRVRRSCVLKDGTQGHMLRLRYGDRETFFGLIAPYMVPSMSYKIEEAATPLAYDEVL